MVDDIWLSRSLPMLQAIYEFETTHTNQVTPEELGEQLGISAVDATVEVERLHNAGYIGGEMMEAWGGDPGLRFVLFGEPRVLERGLRALHAWPSGDPAEELVRLLEERERNTPSPDERSKLHSLIDAVRSVGVQVTSEVLAALIRQQAGL